ncbi:MAG: hypothetical protein AB4426_03240 [Xenococcaceae cyanobacterium]
MGNLGTWGRASLVILALMLGGCNTIESSQVKTVLSRDGLTQVVVPSGWKTQQDLHDDADIQVANTWDESYLIVLSDSKTDFEDITLEEHSQITSQILLENVKNAQVSSEPKELEINGRPAVQYEIRGSVDRIKIIYLHTTVDGKESFHQLVAWTLPSKFQKNRPVLESVINSFKEN